MPGEQATETTACRMLEGPLHGRVYQLRPDQLADELAFVDEPAAPYASPPHVPGLFYRRREGSGGGVWVFDRRGCLGKACAPATVTGGRFECRGNG